MLCRLVSNYASSKGSLFRRKESDVKIFIGMLAPSVQKFTKPFRMLVENTNWLLMSGVFTLSGQISSGLLTNFYSLPKADNI